jgi:hypothetical protein
MPDSAFYIVNMPNHCYISGYYDVNATVLFQASQSERGKLQVKNKETSINTRWLFDTSTSTVQHAQYV